MWPNKKICSACDSAWKDVFCSSRMEEAAEEVDPFLLWILVSFLISLCVYPWVLILHHLVCDCSTRNAVEVHFVPRGTRWR
jgi:hypothetical protein